MTTEPKPMENEYQYPVWYFVLETIVQILKTPGMKLPFPFPAPTMCPNRNNPLPSIS